MKYTRKAELHCHSKSNFLTYVPFVYDSVQTVEEIIAKVISLNISILAITDHDSLEGYHKARTIVKAIGANILIVPACEVSSSKGHILAYGVEKEITPRMTPKETINAIHVQGGIAVAAHPFMIFGIGNQTKNLNFDAIEGHNSAVPRIANNFALKLAKNLDLPCISGSDAHQTSALGNGCMIFQNNVKSVEDVIIAIQNKDFEVESKQTPIFPTLVEHIKKNFELINSSP